MKIALQNLVPKIIGNDITFEVRDLRSKQELLKNLESRLKAYSKLRISRDFRIVVIVDEDRQNCMHLKNLLVEAANAAGVQDITLNRIVVEELEAWYFGDVQALKRVYPRLPDSLGEQKTYRNPDTISGGTWEALDRLLVKHGYRAGLLKLEAAAQISSVMDPWINKSKSFQVFRDGLLRFVGKLP